ncbi:predicted protein [Naegleria gruberi]|uniref:Predicted protein n=1 Tax=Naegleria gruberi TaxID=5762 RepID=D2W527_NAEGR|nr:uncharacterized protein NAEGRDRAFT_76515 [Naegleria gruberi]EFC35825.1 predicted protein [Naegleria gruberi]|eukprot:XP_002668569.1 predicted protein [Naegleria gruberi strain NEG-M]
MEPTNRLIDREVYKDESLRMHLYDEINDLTSELSTKLNLLNSVLSEDTPYHRNQVPFEFLKSMHNLSESISFLTRDTIFERQSEIKFRELEQYANSLERKLVNYKKLGKDSEVSLAQCKKLYTKSKDESNKKIHDLTTSLHGRLDEIQLLKKGLSNEKDITNSLKTEIDRLKYRLSIEVTQTESLRKSNDILRQQLLKTQDYSNFLHKEILKIEDFPLNLKISNLISNETKQSPNLNQTINATSI